MRIVLCYPVEAHQVEQIRQAAAKYDNDKVTHEVVDAGQERIDELLPSADIFIGHAKVPVDWDRVLAAGRLKFIQSSAAGLDHCLVPGVIDSDIVVASASGLFAPQVAEQTFSILFGLLRRIKTFVHAEAKREFIRRPTDDLRGKTVGIVGLGGNGREIAAMLAPWSCEIIATDYYPEDKPPEVAELWHADELPKLLERSDVVVLTLPLNSRTEGIFDAAMIANGKPGAIFINVARGGVVVETALIDALDDGRISAAGLDVTQVEPLSPESRLWDRENVIITPHVGAQSHRRVSDTTDLACLNLSRFFEGKTPLNVVDKNLGFPHPSATVRAYRDE